jgi:5'-phosphate synthase pdxT subunit
MYGQHLDVWAAPRTSTFRGRVFYGHARDLATMKIGVLALQGDFSEHVAMLKRLKVETAEVRLPEHLKGLDGLIIPGGESTTIGKLSEDYGLTEPLRQFGQRHAIWGTCAGAIFLSKDARRSQPLLNLMDITVERNAFGRQVDSFEADLDVAELKRATGTQEPYHAIFIRAPIIQAVGAEARVIASTADKKIVAAQQGHWLATSFHPELTGDTRFHEYFLSLAD